MQKKTVIFKIILLTGSHCLNLFIEIWSHILWYVCQFRRHINIKGSIQKAKYCQCTKIFNVVKFKKYWEFSAETVNYAAKVTHSNHDFVVNSIYYSQQDNLRLLSLWIFYVHWLNSNSLNAGKKTDQKHVNCGGKIFD